MHAISHQSTINILTAVNIVTNVALSTLLGANRAQHWRPCFCVLLIGCKKDSCRGSARWQLNDPVWTRAAPREVLWAPHRQGGARQRNLELFRVGSANHLLFRVGRRTKCGMSKSDSPNQVYISKLNLFMAASKLLESLTKCKAIQILWGTRTSHMNVSFG